MGIRQLFTVVFAALVAGCQGMSMPSLPIISGYHMDIQQGNVVNQEMVSKLQPGMTRAQVRFVLGTPLVTDSFHPDRWDYVYSYEKAGKLIEKRRIVAVFKDDKLVRIDGDVVPSAKPAVNATSTSSPAAAPAAVATPAPAASEPTASALPENNPAPAVPAVVPAPPELKQ